MATYIGLDLGGTNIKISVFDDFFIGSGKSAPPQRSVSVRSTSSTAFTTLCSRFWKSCT